MQATQQYTQQLLDQLKLKYTNVDWCWSGDGEWDECRLVATLDYTDKNRDSKRDFLLKMIIAEGYGE